MNAHILFAPAWTVWHERMSTITESASNTTDVAMTAAAAAVAFAMVALYTIKFPDKYEVGYM